MKVAINVKQIAQIAGALKVYSKMTVSSVGQMFLNRDVAEEAVRTVNGGMDDDNEKIGLLDMDSSMVTLDKLRAYGRNPEAFTELFKDAKIPVEKKSNVKPKAFETPKTVAADEAAEIAAALAGDEKPAPAPAPAPLRK